MKSGSVLLVSVIVFTNVVVKSEPPVQNSGGWGSQSSGSYSQGYNQQSSGGYSGGGGGGAYGPPQVQNSNGGGWGGNQQQQQPLQGGGGGWGNQAQTQSSGGGGGWEMQQSQKQQGGNGGWGQMQNQMKGGQMGGNNGWGPQLNFELDTANLAQSLNPSSLIKSITGLPRRIIKFIRESGLYLLFIPLIIILPLMLLAFNAGRLLGGLSHGWGWSRSLSTVESGIIGYLKSPAWQKVAETLMDEHVFDSVMKSVEKFRKKDW